MAVDHIQHILTHTDDVEGTARWFEDNLGLAHGGNPDYKVPLVGLYVGEVPAIHIAPFPEEGETRRFQDNYLGGRRTDVRYGSGVIDHVAFHCHDLTGTIARLDRKGARYLKRQANEGDLFQLFVDAPNGMRIELNLPAAEAAASGIAPDMTVAEAVSAT